MVHLARMRLGTGTAGLAVRRPAPAVCAREDQRMKGLRQRERQRQAIPVPAVNVVRRGRTRGRNAEGA